MTHNIESEFKLRTTQAVEVAAVDARIAESELLCREARELRYGDTYLDDAERTLAAVGVGLRVRVARGASRITCKLRGRRKGALFVRREYETAWPSPTAPRTAQDLPPALRHVVEPFLQRRPLVPAFRLDVRRSVRELELRGTPLCELALDRVTAHGAGHSAQFTELELEVADDPASCEALARGLGEELGLEPATNDKPTHAADLLGMPTPPAMARLGVAALDEASIGATCRRLLVAVLREETRVRTEEDPEAVHQMRIAVRRLRTVLRAFAAVWPKEEVQWMQSHLRALTRELGQVRDLDATRFVVERTAERLAPEFGAGARDLAEWLHARRTARRSDLLAWLGRSERLEDLQRLCDLLWRGPASDLHGEELRAAVDQQLGERARDLRRRARRLAKPPRIDRIHALRLAGKRLRYLIEELGELAERPPRRTRKLLKRVQDAAGELCDHERACRDLLALGPGAAADGLAEPATLLAIGALAQALRDSVTGAALQARRRIRGALLKKPG